MEIGRKFVKLLQDPLSGPNLSIATHKRDSKVKIWLVKIWDIVEMAKGCRVHSVMGWEQKVLMVIGDYS